MEVPYLPEELWNKIEGHAEEFPTYNDDIEFIGDFSEEKQLEILRVLYDGSGYSTKKCREINLIFDPSEYIDEDLRRWKGDMDILNNLFQYYTKNKLLYDKSSHDLYVKLDFDLRDSHIINYDDYEDYKSSHFLHVLKIKIIGDSYNYKIVVELDTFVGHLKINDDNYDPDLFADYQDYLDEMLPRNILERSLIHLSGDVLDLDVDPYVPQLKYYIPLSLTITQEDIEDCILEYNQDKPY